MEKFKKYIFQILVGVMLIIGLSLIVMVLSDNKTIKNSLISDKKDLQTKIDSYNVKIDNLYKHADSLSMSNLISLKESGLNLQIDLNQFQNEKESEIKGLYLSQIKYWAFLIAAFTSFFVFIGLDWNISNKINKFIAEELEKQKQDILRLIDEKSWEFQLMKMAHIMIANPNNDGDNRDISKVVKWFDEKGSSDSSINLEDIAFDNPESIINAVNKKKLKNRFNILLLENSDGNWDLNNKEENKPNINNAKEIAKNLPADMMLIYFGPRDKGNFPSDTRDYLNVEKTDYKNARKIIDRISFVNAPSKLYSNIIDTLKYMDIINPDINA